MPLTFSACLCGHATGFLICPTFSEFCGAELAAEEAKSACTKFFSYTILIVLLAVATVGQCPCKIQTLFVSRALFPPEANPARWFTLLLVQWTPPPARISVAWQLTSALPRSAEPHTQSVGPPDLPLAGWCNSPGLPLRSPYGAGHAIERRRHESSDL